jgi:hypothetical protein
MALARKHEQPIIFMPPDTRMKGAGGSSVSVIGRNQILFHELVTFNIEK